MNRFRGSVGRLRRSFSSSSWPSKPQKSADPIVKSARKVGHAKEAIAAISLGGLFGAYWWLGKTSEAAVQPNCQPESDASVENWSGTHHADVKEYFHPEDMGQLGHVVATRHELGQKLRPVGSGLSPNGLGFSSKAMVNLAALDRVIEVDSERMQIRVEAGATVTNLLDALRPHGLTLQNIASVKEQQVGGFTQVGAHGTGARIPPVDEQIVEMKLITPQHKEVVLSAESNPTEFALAKVGLGCLGVVSEVTLQCVKRHKLVEQTFVLNHKQIRAQHTTLLASNRHVRYMWIPDTDQVVVVTSNPATQQQQDSDETPTESTKFSHAEKLEPMTKLLETDPSQQVEDRSFADLRDELLARNPLSAKWVAKVNRAEAEFWKRNSGTRVDWSEDVLCFDCGGQQWVLEVCFPAGTQANPTFADLDFMENLMQTIKKAGIPAPAPIEQRWTCGSSSRLSPAHSPKADPSQDLFSWVGIIMYLPLDNPDQRTKVTEAFHNYAQEISPLLKKYGAVEHWAKIEPNSTDEHQNQQKIERLRARYGQATFDEFSALRRKYDPKNILGNEVVDRIFQPPTQK